MKQLLEQYKPHLLALLAIIVISAAFLPGVFSGKELPQSDIIQYRGMSSEFQKYIKQGDEILWTNSQFSGMPTYQISGVTNKHPLKLLRVPSSPPIWDKLFLMMFCSYIMFIAFRVKPWLAVIGAVALAFTSNNIIIIHAGHNTQALAIAYIPLLIAGIQFMFSKRVLLGFNLLLVGLALQILVNHVQMTYYTGIIIGIFMLVKLVIAIREKWILQFFKLSGLAIVAVVIALAANAMSLMLTQEYLKTTIRGKSELTIDPRTKAPKESKPSDGLDIDYAFQWSNGWPDVAALIIPNFAGGGSGTDLGENSVFEGQLPKEAIENFPFAYWGSLPFTEGPIYLGTSVIFLFFLGLLLIKKPYKWWLFSAAILAILLSMGKNNFVWLNDFLFHNLPLYNKFRAPTMALVIAQVCVPILGIIGLNAFLSKPVNDPEREKKLKYAGIGVGGFIILLTFFAGFFTDFSHKITQPGVGVVKDYDQEVFEQYKIEPFKLVEVRKDLIQSDGLRSLFFVALMFGVLWLYHKGKIKMPLTLAAIGLFILVDLWMVDKRYLTGDELVNKGRMNNMVQPTQVDLEIMKDESYYRVLDLRGNPMSNAQTSYFHKSIGGYHAAKLRRYQELFDWHIANELQTGNVTNSPYLNMLNAKYVIYQNQQNNQDNYIQNNNALGNAWFVDEVVIALNADSALSKMTGFNPRREAVVEQEQANYLDGLKLQADSNARIQLTSYHPEELRYKSTSSVEGLAVFSEVYYAEGWNVTIDDQPVDHIRANYVLRALRIPAGEHEIVFTFAPETYDKSKTITNVASGLIFLLLLGSIGWGVRNKLKKTE